MNQLVPGRNDHAPGNLGVVLPHCRRDVGGGLSDEFDVAQRGVVAHAVGREIFSVQGLCLGKNSFTKPNHVPNAKTPFALRLPLKHERRRVRPQVVVRVEVLSA